MCRVRCRRRTLSLFILPLKWTGVGRKLGIGENECVCNRYRLTHSKQYLAERFQAADDEVEEHPRYNIAPTQPVLTVRKEQGKKIRHFTTMRWGLIPSWAKDVSIVNRTLNAQSATVTSTPAFRDSILTKRCLIPADGFYEWRKMGSVKQPYCFEVGEGEVFAFADCGMSGGARMERSLKVARS